LQKGDQYPKTIPTIISVEQDGIKGELKLEPFVLPNQERFAVLQRFRGQVDRRDGIVSRDFISIARIE
jgi:hypothetical protein